MPFNTASIRYIVISLILLLLTFAFHCSFGQNLQDQENRSELPKMKTESLNIETDVDLYPNPAIDYLNITLKNSQLKKVEIEMYNVIGNKLEFEMDMVSSNSYKLNVKNLHSGYYLIIIKDPISRYNKAYKFRKQ